MTIDIKQKAIARAVAYLVAAGAEYHIKPAEGDELVSPAFQRKPVVTRRPKGTLSDIYLPVVEHMQAGQMATVQVPHDEDINKFRSAMCGWMVRAWGAESFITELDRESNKITVLRAM